MIAYLLLRIECWLLGICFRHGVEKVEHFGSGGIHASCSVCDWEKGKSHEARMLATVNRVKRARGVL